MTTNAQVVTDERRCSRQTVEDIGRFHDQLQIKYVFQQQAPTGVDNMAFRTFKRGTTGFFVPRYGTAFEPDITAGDVAGL